MVRYTHDQPLCNYGSGATLGDMEEIASHEYAEMVTDPEIGYVDVQGVNHTGWQTSDGAEIADLCNNGAQPYRPTNSPLDLLYVTELYDNWAADPTNPCVLAYGTEYLSPDTTAPFNGKHTVQGYILDQYKSLNEVNGTLKEPTSEQQPLAGGYVSYFQGTNCTISPCAAIYWSASTGDWAVWGDNYKKYTSLGGPTDSALGFPVSNPVSAGGGLANYFGAGGSGPYGSKAAIYWSSATGAHAVWGDDYRDYLSHTASLGLPLSDPLFSFPGAPAYFVGPPSCTPQNNCGAIYGHSPQEHTLCGATPISTISVIRMRPSHRRPDFSLPGDPATFENGVIYWSSATEPTPCGGTPISTISVIRTRSAFRPATQTSLFQGTPPTLSAPRRVAPPPPKDPTAAAEPSIGRRPPERMPSGGMTTCCT